jgi:hypothetical protein
MPTTVFAELTAVYKLKPRPAEDQNDFAERAVEKIDKTEGDDEWDQLTPQAQAWVNEGVKVAARRKALRKQEGDHLLPAFSDLDGWPAEAAEPATEEEKEVTTTKESKSSKATKAAKAVVAKVKKAKPEAKAKKAAKGTGRGRAPNYAADAKIKLLVKDNPHRAGTGRFKRWPKYKSGMTVSEAIKAGLTYQNLRFSVLDGHIAIGG